MNLHYLDKNDARNVLREQQSDVNGKRRVAIDVRVSTQHEMQMNALGNQEQWALELASKHDDWIFNPEKDLYIEEGISGTSLNKRLAFSEMISKAKSGVYNLIVVREVCRFMRNAKETLILVDELKKCGVEVWFVNDGIRTFNQDDYFKLTVMAQYAEQESRKISERVFSGQATARSNGVLFGNGNILGYRHIKGDKSYESTYEIDEEQAKTVRKIFELCIMGYGMKKIKNYLESHDYKTSSGNSKWDVATIQRIIHNRTYMGMVEHFQSVTVDPLTHKRSKVSKDKRVLVKSNLPPIIDGDTWDKAQLAVESRTNHDFSKGVGSGINGICVNKDVLCRKMRCGCGRRFKKDVQTQNNTATYRCYQVVDDGSQEVRIERSKILGDDCCIVGIRDWKMGYITREVFRYLNCNLDDVKERLIEAVDKNYKEETQMGYSSEDILKIDVAIDKIKERNNNLLDMREDGTIDKEQYVERKKKNDDELSKLLATKDRLSAMKFAEDNKESTLEAVKKFFDDNILLPNKIGDVIPETMIETYINSIKVCADNKYEYNIKVNPYAENVSALVVPDEEFIPSVHSASKVIDNSDAVLVAEFTLGYEEAKTYANRLKRKVNRVHWQKPVTVKIFARM